MPEYSVDIFAGQLASTIITYSCLAFNGICFILGLVFAILLSINPNSVAYAVMVGICLGTPMIILTIIVIRGCWEKYSIRQEVLLDA
jgi:hypothetical protein